MRSIKYVTISVMVSLFAVICWVNFHAFDLRRTALSSINEENVSRGNPQQVGRVQVAPVNANLPQENPPATSVSEQQGLAIHLQTDRSVYMLGEPVSVTVAIQNHSAAPIIIYDLFYLQAGNTHVQIRDDTSEFRYYRGPFPVVSTVAVSRTLTPDTQLSLSFSILYNVSTSQDDLPYFYAFDQPGHYQLRAVLNDILPNVLLVSAPLTVAMLAPQGVDAQLWRLLQTEDAASFLQTGSARNAMVVERFQAIVAQYPDSFYAPLMSAALGPAYTATITPKPQTQAANFLSHPLIRKIDEQLYLVRSTSEVNSRPANSIDGEILNKIIDAVRVWVDAWNNRDMERYVQSYSFTTTFRQKWEKGPGNLNHDTIRERLPGTFQSKGIVSVDIIGFNMGTEEIILEIVGRFEPGSGQGDFFDTMRFIKDDDSVWRLVSPGWQ